MLKYTLIYLWIYIGIHGAVEVKAGDAEEHVHIKLHMPKTAVRKSLHRNHVRQKKTPPPYISSSPHRHAASVTGPGAAMHSQHSVYHEAPHNNYLTAMGAQSLHDLHHHMKQQQQSSPTMAMTHLQPMVGTGIGGQQQLLDAQYYGSADGTGSSGAAAELGGLLGDTNGGDYMAYLTKSFASFPQPTFETEIISSPMANEDLAYQQSREEEEQGYRKQHQQHYTTLKHHHRQPYETAATSVVAAANHELDEDNEILGPLGRASSVMEQSERSAQHQHPTKQYRGGLSSSVKSLKNEHMLRHVMQQQQHLYPDVDNNQDMQSVAMQRSRNRYRDDKLYKEALENARDDAMEVLNTYEDMDMDAVAHRDDDDLEGRQRGVMGAGNDGGITPLTVDDIWSQLQRAYLNKYTPQAQPNEMLEEDHESTSLTPSKKQKRNSQKIKSRKRNYQSKAATPTAAAATATVRTLSYENNYYNQEHQGKPSTFYDSHTPQSSSYGSSYAAFSPFSSSFPTSSSSASPAERDFYDTRATSPTRPSYQNFKTFSNFDDTTAAGVADEEDNNEDEDANDDVSSEVSVFSSSRNKYGNNRSHRHNHGSVAYGHADTLNNNPFNYHDLYASYSTPIAQATIATYPNYQASTYHPNAYNVAGPTPSSSASASLSSSLLSSPLNPQTPHQLQAQSIYPTGHESTSYQWREQQHYPASYQSYHTSSSHHQQQQKPQQQHLQQLHPHTQQYQQQTSSALHLPKATVASASSASLSHHSHPLATAGASSSLSSSSSSSSSLSSSPFSPILSTNDFTSAVKQSSIAQQQRNKKRKNRLKSKRNRIVVT